MFVHSLMSAITLRSTQHAEGCTEAGMALHKCGRLRVSYRDIEDENLHPLSSSRDVVSCRLT